MEIHIDLVGPLRGLSEEVTVYIEEGELVSQHSVKHLVRDVLSRRTTLEGPGGKSLKALLDSSYLWDRFGRLGDVFRVAPGGRLSLIPPVWEGRE